MKSRNLAAASSPDAKGRKTHTAAKHAEQIANLKNLPDWAAVSINVVVALTNRCRASVYRDVASGLLPRPFKHGNSTRWRIGDLRRALEQA